MDVFVVAFVAIFLEERDDVAFVGKGLVIHLSGAAERDRLPVG